MKKKLLLISINLIFINSCSITKQRLSNDHVFAKENDYINNGINFSYMDKNIRPQDDFYSYVNGNWQNNIVIPSDLSSIDLSDILTIKITNELINILHNIVKEEQMPDSEKEKIKNLYLTYLASYDQNLKDIELINLELNQINSINNLEDLQEYLISSTKQNFNPLYNWNLTTETNNKNEKYNVVYLNSPSLSLDDNYYDITDTDNLETLAAYEKYVTKVFNILDEEHANKKAKQIIDFEIQLSKTNSKNDKLKLTVSELSNLTKNINFKKYLADIGVKSDSIIIYNQGYYENIDRIITQNNIPLIKSYLKYHLLNKNANYLTKELSQANFEFYLKYLEGQEQPLSQDAKFIELVENTMGETFGKYYVEEYFSPEAKKQIEVYTDYLKKAFKKRINDLDWMTDATKKNALEKLAKIKINIGYPEQWTDYSDLKIYSPDEGASLFSNINNYNKWSYNKKLDDVNKLTDKSKWLNVPQVVTAFYIPSYNQMFFAAAYLQFPFFDKNLDPAINFGGIGAIIGHEISHAFDNNGSRFDSEGNINNWWTDEDKIAFDKKVDQLASQYNQYEPIQGYFINGKLTSGENIGDLGGVSVAYDALQLYLKDYGDPGLIDGLSQNERFFISYAAGYKDKRTDQFLKNQLKTDPHPPGYYRVIGTLSNLDYFIETFNVKQGDKMYKEPTSRIKIW